MDISLTSGEVRVLGCLLEKKMATPEYYPLSLNALVNACNQKVNRTPVVTYDEPTVLRAIEGLRSKKLLWINTSGRVDKYAEGLVEQVELSQDQAAVMCILLLRGPQTVGEIRGRTDRLFTFDSLEAVHQTREGLVTMGYVEQLARQPGQKEIRFNHRLGSEEVDNDEEADPASESGATPDANPERFDQLEAKVTALAEELSDLREAFEIFKQQFE